MPPEVVRETVWSPNPGTQALFLTCNLRECLYEGTRGRGATDALLMDFARDCGQGWGAQWRGILFRRAYPQLADVQARARRWFPRLENAPTENRSDHSWTWPTGEQLLFRFMSSGDDYYAYHGHEYPWVGWEELTNWPSAECYQIMKSCNRTSHPGLIRCRGTCALPDATCGCSLAAGLPATRVALPIHPGCTCVVQSMPRRYRANTNPHGVGHSWVKSYYQIPETPAGRPIVEHRAWPRVRLHGHYRENRALMASEPDYQQTIRSAAGHDPNRLRAWDEGSWEIAAGGIFEGVWDGNVQIIDEFEIPRNWYVDRAHDWGSSSPYCTLWFAESNGEDVQQKDGTWRRWPRGTVFVIGEDYGWNGVPNRGLHLSSAAIVARAIRAEETMGIRGVVRDGPGDGIWDVRDGTSTAMEMERAGIRWTQPIKGKGSRVTGWQKIRDMLGATLAQPMEQPGLFIFRRCHNVIRTVSLPRDPGNPDDVDTDAEDHAWDAVRYRVTMKVSALGVGSIHGPH